MKTTHHRDHVGKAKQGAKAAKAAVLHRALGQSELVQDKVEQAASDLGTVNAVLRREVTGKAQPAKVKKALDKSEGVETKVHEASEELVAVNEALADEISERLVLEERLATTDAALAVSRTDGDRFRHDSLHDRATGLPNLDLFNDRLRNAIAQAQRHHWRLAVMFLDLNEFKRVNDKHGHDAGDAVLNFVARRLQAAVRTGDTVSRRSGDEFLFLMLEAQDEANVAAFAGRIIKNIASPCDIGGLHLSVKASVGIAIYPEDAQSAENLLKNADAAMYISKKTRGELTFYSAIRPPATAALKA